MAASRISSQSTRLCPPLQLLWRSALWATPDNKDIALLIVRVAEHHLLLGREAASADVAPAPHLRRGAGQVSPVCTGLDVVAGLGEPPTPAALHLLQEEVPPSCYQPSCSPEWPGGLFRSSGGLSGGGPGPRPEGTSSPGDAEGPGPAPNSVAHSCRPVMGGVGLPTPHPHICNSSWA